MAERPRGSESGAVDGRTRRWDDHKSARRDRILRAGLAAIRRDGPAVAVQEIATHAEVPRSVVYRIFKDREDLDEQLRARIVEELMGALAPVLEPADTLEVALPRAVDAYVGWVLENQRLHQFLALGSGVVTEARTAIAARVERALVLILRKRPDALPLADLMAFAITGLVDAAVTRWLADPHPALTAGQLSAFLQDAIGQVIAARLREARR
ncbi:TetR/AcrR family transcriptional regulator [Nocardia sp. NPDC050697]|uniref:TetR/AcrR family transcriptional regulator n=1 Tax=Nocardia sp. NPDC050697 TaxID=3155158 RepID=UPI0033C660BB